MVNNGSRHSLPPIKDAATNMRKPGKIRPYSGVDPRRLQGLESSRSLNALSSGRNIKKSRLSTKSASNKNFLSTKGSSDKLHTEIETVLNSLIGRKNF